MSRRELKWLNKWQFWMVLIILLVIVLLTSGCSVQQKCARIERKIINGAKQCLSLNRNDTITVHDTLMLGTVRHDSTFVMRQEIDTFYINKDRLHVQIFKEHDTLRVIGQCDSIFIVKEIKVPYEQVYVKELNAWIWKATRFGKRFLWLILIGIAIYLLYRFRKYLPV